MIDTVVTPVRAPRWTQKRFVDMLADCYGPSPRGPIDIAAVAAHVGVTPATVRRWLHNDRGAPSRVRAGVPRRRLTQIQRASEEVEDRNEGRYRYALSAIAQIQAGQILPPWRDQNWLDDHIVAIVEIHDKPWHQVVVTKGNHRALAALRRRAGILQTEVTPHRFYAEALAHRVMIRQQHWRVHPAKSQLAIGRTQVWMADAPAIDLKPLALPTETGRGRASLP